MIALISIYRAISQYIDYRDRPSMYCFFIMAVLMCTAYTNLENTFLSIEKQRSIVDAWGLDLQNDI